MQWLLENRIVWQGYRLNDRTVQSIHGMMQVAGLYKFTTQWYCSQDNVRKMICKLRKGLDAHD